ncbi:MAG: hypothetical protein HUU02_14660 [Bacteroidetes bacterium]|nr:hypothetical protein [Bacteroidota bacterium]
MRTSAVALLILLLPFSAFSQTTIFSSGDAGYFLYHSDNLLPITEDEDISFHYGGSVGVEMPLSEDFMVRMEAAFFRTGTTTLFDNILIASPPSFTITTRSATLVQRTFPVDISLSPRTAAGLSYAAGISFAYTNRRTEFPFQSGMDPFIDAFNSFGIGVNGSIRSMFAVDDDGRFLLFGALKLRYIHTVLYEGNGRDLSGYTLEYFHGHCSVGLAWRLW